MPQSDHTAQKQDRAPPRDSRAALLLGVGFGGFVDGIGFHEILQWHHILSDEGCCPTKTVAGLEDNTLADGFFHVITWLFVFAGTIAATRAWQQGRLAPPWRLHFGAMLAGWGAFNLIEGLVNHQILGIHHLRDDLGGPLAWDLGFLAFGVVLMLIGWTLKRHGSRRSPKRARE